MRTLDCVLCGRHGTQAAHLNMGKGLGQKVSDCLTAALCPACHAEIDQGQHLTRPMRRSLMDRALALTLERLVQAGLVAPTRGP